MRGWSSLVVAALLAAGCAPGFKQTPHDRRFQSAAQPELHKRPQVRFRSNWANALAQSSARPLGETLSPGFWLDELFGPARALDINRFGEVVDSSWFTNRLGRAPMTKLDVARGPDTISGPASGALTVIDGKLSGITPGMVVEDRLGRRFVVKFDPPAFPEMASGAEIISTNILHAAGYNVPENYVVDVDLSRLALGPSARTSGKYGASVPLDQARLDQLISNVNPIPGGTVRALFSRFIEGQLLGPFEYRGARPDDPNDVLPHDRRRSLRGLRLFMAWINNVDARAENTLDTFLPVEGAGGRGTVRHYLLDFGDALGSSGNRSKVLHEGYEHTVDWAEIGKIFFTAGIYYPYWLPVLRSPYRSVGIYESQVFDVAKWAPRLPNPAFDRADALDDYWAASIIARFTPDHLLGIVARARYSEPGATAWVLRVLTARQYKILDYAFARVLPLDDPRVDGSVVSMRDLAVDASMMMAPGTHYRWSARWNRSGGSDVALGQGGGPRPLVDLGPLIQRWRGEHRAEAEADPFITVRWHRPSDEGVGPGVELHLRIVEEGIVMVGIDRDIH